MANLRANNISGAGGRNAIDGSVAFTTSSGYLSVTSDTIGTSAFTIEWWFKPQDRTEPGTANRRMFRLGANNATGSMSINYDAVNNDIQWNYDAATILAASTIKIYDNSWYHIAAVREGTGSNETKLYINGVLSDSVTLSTDFTQTALQIGWDSTLGDDFGFYGNISNLRVTKSAVYTAAFTPPTEKLRGVVDTILLCCQDSNDVTVDAVGKTITSGGTPGPKATKVTPSVGIDEGVVFGGDPKFNTQGVMYFPTGDTSQRGRGRGLFGGGVNGAPTATANIAYINIQSQGNTTKFGDLTATNRVWISGFGSSTRAIWPGGTTYDGSNPTNIIDFVTIATTSNATDFGDLTSATTNMGACSSQIRGVIGGGYISPANINTIDYVTIASAGNAADFGDITVARRGIASMGSSTRGVFAGGMGSPALVDTIDYVTISTLGNAVDFGDMTQASRNDCGGCSSGTRGIIAGGKTSPANINTIQFITIASTGNASDFGDLQETMATPSSLSNSIRGVFSGSYSPDSNTINFVNIATTGNASDFGDNTLSTSGAGGTSDSHGGLS